LIEEFTMPRVEIPAAFNEDPSSFVWSKLVPQVAAAAGGYSTAVYRHSRLSLREFEAARVRTAQINGCLVCQNWRAHRDLAPYVERMGSDARGSVVDRGDAVPDEAFYAAIENWRRGVSFSERERLAIEFADRMGLEPKSLAKDDEFWDRVHAHFSDAEIADLAFSIGSWMALGRVTHVLGLDTTCAVTSTSAAA
jgi:alkylhydroperoxidase family enzyme